MTPAIVHLGLGAFWRAFGLPWIEEVDRDGRWKTLGVSLRSASVRDALATNSFTYHAMEKAPGDARLRQITSLSDVVVAPEDPEAVIAAMADGDVRLVTLTVTEKGYCHFPATGELDQSHPGIQHDLAYPDKPQTVPGFLVAALARRRAAGLDGFTAMTCDNLPRNGAILRSVTLDFARLVDQDLADWIAANCAFPGTMIDRIVPATTKADIAEIGRLTGTNDHGAVVHEPFRQWVIEDRFAGTRPDFEQAGILLTDDVAPYEEMKLRCLNGTHSAIAYLGVMAGLDNVAQAAADPVIKRFIEGLWREEITQSFTAPKGVDLAGYTAALMTRYENQSIKHRTIQIAMDGSQKLPQRILGPIADNLRNGVSIERLACVVAGWMRFLRGRSDAGISHQIIDPLAEMLIDAATQEDPVVSLLALDAIFEPELAAQPRFRQAVQTAYDAMERNGTKAYLEGFA